MPKKTPTPHDALFKFTMSKSDNAVSLLKRLIPPALAARLDWSRMTLDDASLTDSDLSGKKTDLLYKLPLLAPGRSQPDALVTFILEHQSTPDPLMAFRVLRYTVRVWSRWLQQAGNAELGVLPIVLPVVIYHGDKAWTAAPDVRDLIDTAFLPINLVRIIHGLSPTQRYTLLDLSQTKDADIQGTLDLVLCLLLFKSPKGSDLVAVYKRFVAEHGRIETTEALAAFIDYIWTIDPKLKKIKNHARMLETFTNETGENHVGIAELFRQDGIEIGLEKGIERGLERGLERGRQEGARRGQTALATTLTGLLARRFKVVSKDQREQIAAASIERLQQVIDAIFDLSGVDEAMDLLAA